MYHSVEMWRYCMTMQIVIQLVASASASAIAPRHKAVGLSLSDEMVTARCNEVKCSKTVPLEKRSPASARQAGSLYTSRTIWLQEGDTA